MIRGRFGNTSRRPYIEGRLIFPRLDITSDISFLADTGADTTVILPLDGQKCGLDYSVLQNPIDTTGMGGLYRSFREQAIVMFYDDVGFLQIYASEIQIAPPSQDIATVPSLLGRDIMNNWIITFAGLRNQLYAEVVSATISVPVPPVLGAASLQPPPLLLRDET